MKYRIDSKNFFARKEEEETLSVMVLKTNQILYFNRMGKRIFDHCDRWVDLDDFVLSLNLKGVPLERVRKDFEELLYELDALGLAGLKELPVSQKSGCRVAEKKDYRNISDFLLAFSDKGLSCATTLDARYNGRHGVYMRIRSKSAYYVIREHEGEITSLLELVCPNRHMGISALSIQSAVFADGIKEDDFLTQLSQLTDIAAAYFASDFSKLRYAYMHKRQDHMRDALLKCCGFTESAHFFGELRGGQDLIYYDRFI